MVIPLCNINPGDSARVVYLGNEDAMAGRLRDLGFVPDAMISCVMQRPKKNIAAYLVRNAVIALRKKDSRFVLVEVCEKKEAQPQMNSSQRTDSEMAGSDSRLGSSARTATGEDAICEVLS